MSRATRRIVAALTLTVLLLTPAAAASAAPWVPEKGTKWQWILSAPLTNSAQALKVPVFNIDGFDNPASRIASLRSQGKHAICYISAGSVENWRPDVAKFPAAVKGQSLDGWPGERWLDIRRTDVLLPLMRARMQMCAQKGFQTVEPDNVDGYSNATGFPLTAAHQLTYNRALAATAHSLGLSIALKNDVEQVVALEPYFDFAINEECQQYDTCGVYAAFLNKGKAVLHVEYTGPVWEICSQRLPGMSTMKKSYALDAWRQYC